VLVYDSPNAGIVPFFLYENPEKPWMCPVRAWAAWWHHCRYLGLDMNGYVFRKKWDEMVLAQTLMMGW
jgi:hypothetical protein